MGLSEPSVAQSSVRGAELAGFAQAVVDRKPVAGFTHNFYRYPARFSPQFARATIELFSEPGDWVFDPFCGGGTTLVEALATGRNSVGMDISTLAKFIGSTKTSFLPRRAIREVELVAEQIPDQLKISRWPIRHQEWIEAGYQRNLNTRSTWRFRKLIELALCEFGGVSSDRVERFLRCCLLKTGQWALDGRKHLPTTAQFRDRLQKNIFEMMGQLDELRSACTKAAHLYELKKRPKSLLVNRRAQNAHEDGLWAATPRPKLVLTSPPYPGVHVLYHRWQIGGGKESPVPFWISNCLDGAGGSYYTMGDRKQENLKRYFDDAQSIFSAVRQIVDTGATVVQLIGFSEPDWQLPEYLARMEIAGFQERRVPHFSEHPDGRLWREVPNRRWHADQIGPTSGSQEVVLIHDPV